MDNDDQNDELKHLPLVLITFNPYQPRREFKVEELEQLAQSIRTVGLLHPPLVRPLPGSSQYELISGERRFRAAQLACLSTIPVYIRQTSSQLSAQAALIENIQRVDLNPLEIAKALKRLTLEFGLSQEELAQRIGKKRSTVANYLRLLTLPLVIQEGLQHERITMGHAKAILGIEREEEQSFLYEQIVKKQLTVRQAEQWVTTLKRKIKGQEQASRDVSKSLYLEEWTRHIRECLGSKVCIRPKGEKEGELCIDYHSWEELEHLYLLLTSESRSSVIKQEVE